MEYSAALALQRTLHAELVAGRGSNSPMRLLLLEHNPSVITVNRKPDAMRHVLANAEQLAQHKVHLVETDRGGDVTWHGVGQLVAYPILDLHRIGLRIHSYMRMLEQVVIDTLADFQIKGLRDTTATGVWVGEGAPLRKMCAMGVRVSRWATLHGLALNVNPALSNFQLIVPCGLAGRSVTSMQLELGARAPTLLQVKQKLAEHFEQTVEELVRQAIASGEHEPGP